MMKRKESMKKARKPSPAPSTPATSPPGTSLPGTSSTSAEVDTAPTAPDPDDYVVINLDEGAEVMEDVVEEEGDTDDDDIEMDDPVPAPPGGEQQPQPRKRRRKSTNIILYSCGHSLANSCIRFS